MQDDVEHTNSGVSRKGSWKDVSKFGERVENLLKKRADEESLREFANWRPKTEEAENDLHNKTIEKASLEQRKIEEKSEGLDELRNASSKVKEAGAAAAEKEIPREHVSEASRSVLRPLFSSLAKAARRLEELAYSKVLLRSDRWYFDSDEFSADMKSTRDGEYRMEVNVSEKEHRDHLHENLGDE